MRLDGIATGCMLTESPPQDLVVLARQSLCERSVLLRLGLVQNAFFLGGAGAI